MWLKCSPVPGLSSPSGGVAPGVSHWCSRPPFLSLASVLRGGLCFRGGDPPRRLQCVPVQEAPSPCLSEQRQTEAAVQGQRLSAPVPLLAHAAREPSRAQGTPGPRGVGRVFCTPRNRQHGPFWDRRQNGTSEESQLPEISGVVASIPLPLEARTPDLWCLQRGFWPCFYKYNPGLVLQLALGRNI